MCINIDMAHFSYVIGKTLNKSGRVRINVTTRRVRVTTIVGNARSNTYSGCVSVALVIQHAIALKPYYNVICGLSESTAFFFPHYLINGTLLGKKKLLNVKMCTFFFFFF